MRQILVANKLGQRQRHPLLEKGSCRMPWIHPLLYRVMLTRTGSKPGGHSDPSALYCPRAQSAGRNG